MRLSSALVAAATAVVGAALAATPARATQVEPPGDVPRLEPGVRAEIAGGQRHGYALPLKAGDYVKVLVDQHGIDLMLSASTPDGQPIVETNFRATSDGTDWITLLAETDGVYRIVVRPRLADAAAGRYEVKLNGPRPASPGDRTFARADRLFAEGHTLLRDGSASSLEQAVLRFEEAANVYRESNSLPMVARALGDAGVTHSRLGQFVQALERYQQSLPLRRAARDRRGEALTLSNMGLAYNAQGKVRDALQVHSEAMAIWRELGDRHGRAFTLSAVADAYIRLGDYQPALETLRGALALSREARERANEAQLLTTLGGVYSSLGEPHQGLPLLQEALAAYRTLDNRRGEAVALGELGALQQKIGRLGEAEAAHEKSAGLLEAVGDAQAEGHARLRLGHVYRAQGRLPAAAAEYEKGRALARQSGDPNNEAAALIELAVLRSKEDRRDDALRLIAEARPLLDGLGPTRGAAVQRHVIAGVLRQVGDLEGARQESATAVALVDAYRGAVAAPDLRSSYLAEVHSFYERHADVLMRLHERDGTAGLAAAALETLEHGRARTLVEQLTEGQHAVRDDAPAALLQREQDVHARITTLQGRLLGPPAKSGEAPVKREALLRELESTERQRQEVEEEIRRTSPRYSRVRYPEALSAKSIQALLDPETALLEYSLGEAPYLFVVTRDGITTHRLPGGAEIGQEVVRFREAVRTPSRLRRSAYLRTARRLYELLVAPALPVLEGKRRLIVVPDRVLVYLPFEALLAELPRASTVDKDLPYLVRRWTVAYIPSASTLASLRERRREAPGLSAAQRKDVVAFADPVGWTSEPSPKARTDEAGESPLRGMLEDLGLTALRPLPDSRREAEDLQRSLGRQAVTVYVGAAATEENVKSSAEVATARRLHFATHALVSATRPNHSALVLSRTPGGREDGLLQGFEVSNLKLQAELVVLSACETGLGRQLSGEGMIGLTRAFLHAGADRVAATLWEVADRSTADLMSAFYRHMETVPGTGEALQKAKLHLIAGGRFAHPYYWAPFVLVGEP